MAISTRAFATPEAAAPAGAGHKTFEPASARVPWIALAIFSLFIFLAVFADWIVPHSPYVTSLGKRLLPPAWLAGGDWSYTLGTDRLGRDNLSRIILGARVSIIAGVAAVAVAASIGTALGLIAGYCGGWIDALIMRTADAMLSFPLILIALLFAVTFGPSFGNLIIVLALVMWARFARLVRGETLAWKERDFVALAQVAGCSTLRILTRHILPNIVSALVVLGTLQVGWVIIVEASLSFLGAGVPPPNPSWGGLIADGRNYISTAWWLSFFPGLAIVMLVMSVNLIGDWLRDLLDPKMRDVR